MRARRRSRNTFTECLRNLGGASVASRRSSGGQTFAGVTRTFRHGTSRRHALARVVLRCHDAILSRRQRLSERRRPPGGPTPCSCDQVAMPWTNDSIAFAIALQSLIQQKPTSSLHGETGSPSERDRDARVEDGFPVFPGREVATRNRPADTPRSREALRRRQSSQGKSINEGQWPIEGHRQPARRHYAADDRLVGLQRGRAASAW